MGRMGIAIKRIYEEPTASDGYRVDNLRHICAEHPDVTLLYAAKDPHINHALVLRDYLN